MKTLIIYTVIVVILLFYLIFGHNGVVKYNEMLSVQNSYENELKKLDEKVAYLQRELELIKQDNAYLDYVIKRELGLQKSDEDQYLLLDHATILGH
ncbi:MAG: septum formation initiator family protein [Deferribacteraceae bacterium]|jgi:cell division protein FtsB|nr:septum formation initiator family protein [Deferribacteraceae bacterium]